MLFGNVYTIIILQCMSWMRGYIGTYMWTGNRGYKYAVYTVHYRNFKSDQR